MATRAYNDFKIAPHFSLREFECRCCGQVRLSVRLVVLLEELRARWGRPIAVTSGYRCHARNLAVGGAEHSLHMRGQAADIAAVGAHQRLAAELARSVGFDEVLPGGAGNYLHVGIRRPA